jgi:hypothetical protein
MRFAWRIDGGGGGAGAPPASGREFNIIPDRGAVLPGERQAVRVELISQRVGVYSGVALVLDLPNIEDTAMRLPIAAECVVPRLAIASPTLDFGVCFLQHPVRRAMRLLNAEALPAKFRVEAQDAAGAALAEFTAEPASGAIAGQSALRDFKDVG